jgi:nucleoside recognition membrane protein YjiH
MGLNIRYANVSVSDTEHLMSHGHRVSANLFSLSLSQICFYKTKISLKVVEYEITWYETTLLTR